MSVFPLFATVPDAEVTAKGDEEHFVDSERNGAECGTLQTDSSPGKVPPQHTPSPLSPVALAAGFFGGCLQSAFGTGGPPVLVYAREAGWEFRPESFRANLQLVFLSMNDAISSEVAAGIVTAETLRYLYGPPVAVRPGHEVRNGTEGLFVGMAALSSPPPSPSPS